MIPLESLTACFQGLIPSWLATCSKDGVPNMAILSHVDYVDARHVAMSYQFFNKSKRNILENPWAHVRVIDPDTFQAYAMRVRYVRTETEGALFDSMRLRIEAIASYMGLKGIFRLLGADIYEVTAVEKLGHEGGVVSPRAAQGAAKPPFTLRALQEFSERIQQASTLDAMLDAILETLEHTFGFRHSMILLASERPDRLELIASRGYPEGGVGSEVAFGEGIIGMVAEARKPIRIAGMLRHMLYADAVAKRAEAQGVGAAERRIPLPGLAEPELQLGIPLLARDELVGVLCVEEEGAWNFHEEDRAYLEVLGGFLAIAIQNALLRESTEEDEDAVAAAAPSRPATAPATASGPRLEFYRADECVLADGEYLVRGLPAKILWKVLTEHAASGCVEFTNRRLRLDKSLDLPEIKDNLESRLILLRRRLEERLPQVRLVQSGRGRFRLELEAPVTLRDHA